MIKFNSPLIKGTLIKRYKRFLADVKLESGEEITAHCPNTGSMKTCQWEGATVYLTHHDDPKRKLKYTWELTETDGGYICVNTHRPNRIVEQAILDDQIPELSGYANLKREKKYGENSKIDLFLSGHESQPDCYVEIKNVTLKEGDTITFPDAVTTRGTKHLNELQNVAKAGDRAVIFYLVNRPDGKEFGIAGDIDPVYNETFKKVTKKDVEVLIYQSKASMEGIEIDQKLPLTKA